MNHLYLNLKLYDSHVNFKELCYYQGESVEWKRGNLRMEFVWFEETKEQRNTITSLSPDFFYGRKKLLDFKRERQWKRERERVCGVWFSFSTFCFSLLIIMIFFR